MRILYLSSSYIPSRRASSVHVMKMCHALARQHHHVTLVTKHTPQRQEPSVVDDYAFYGVAPNFVIRKLARPLFRGGELVYTWQIIQLLRTSQPKPDLVYGRHLFGVWLVAMLGYPVVFEAHGVPQGAINRLAWRRLLASPQFKRLVVISDALKNDLAASDLLPQSTKVIVAHDGANPVPHSNTDSHSTHLPQNNRPNISYVGQLYRGKGIELVVDLANQTPSYDYHIIGGSHQDLAEWQCRDLPKNIVFHGFVAPSELEMYYQASDILLLPPQRTVFGATGDLDIARWMSPMKMFEYMATGKPIISSDLPVLREVLEDGRNALLVPPDDVVAWATTIQKLLANPTLGKRLGENAKADLMNHYTWDARANKVLDGI